MYKQNWALDNPQSCLSPRPVSMVRQKNPVYPTIYP